MFYPNLPRIILLVEVFLNTIRYQFVKKLAILSFAASTCCLEKFFRLIIILQDKEALATRRSKVSPIIQSETKIYYEILVKVSGFIKGRSNLLNKISSIQRDREFENFIHKCLADSVNSLTTD